MICLVAVLGTFLLPFAPLESSAERGVLLRYAPALGSVAHHRLILHARGEQVSLGEHLPTDWRGQMAVREEVVGRGADGQIWLRTSGRLLDITDATGSLAGGLPQQWPAVEMRISSRGELLALEGAVGEDISTARQRAFVEMVGRPRPVVLPMGPVEIGDCWEWRGNGVVQRSRLLGIEERAGRLLATIATEAETPLELDEHVAALGLHTHLTGRVEETSELTLAVGDGAIERHTGQLQITTDSRVRLELAEGDERFEMESRLVIDFDMTAAEAGAGAR